MTVSPVTFERIEVSREKLDEYHVLTDVCEYRKTTGKRRIGFYVRFARVEYRPRTEADSSYWLKKSPELVWFEAWVTPTRDGNRYGPAFNDAQFLSLDDAKAYADKRIVTGTKRYKKQVAKRPAVFSMYDGR
jgi:hypothetical protein